MRNNCPSVCPLFPTELCRNQARMIMEKYLHKCSIAGEAITLVTNSFPSMSQLLANSTGSASAISIIIRADLLQGCFKTKL